MKVEALIVTAVKFVSNRMPYILWKGCWSGIVLKVCSVADGNSGFKVEFL
jgi:hypothetical protein